MTSSDYHCNLHHYNCTLHCVHCLLGYNSCMKTLLTQQRIEVVNRLIECCMLCCTFGSSCAPLTSCLNKDFGPLPLTVCLFLPSEFLLLDVAPYLSVAHVYTVRNDLPLELPPHHLCLHLSNGEKCTYFIAPIPSYLSTVPPLCDP